MEFSSMTCRNCAQKLSIANDADQCICQNCGAEYLVTFRDSTISIKTLANTQQDFSRHADRTASELALVRINQAINDLYATYKPKDMIYHAIWQETSSPLGYEMEPKWLEIEKTHKLNDYPIDLDDLMYLRNYCEKYKQELSQSWLPDKKWLKILDEYINSLDLFIPALRELLEEKKHHMKVVAL